ncbi:hypothetical protein D8674_013108 [Pyrus ussuriensis x Pyrus communis]|uniref:Uncharacterized protein n=1 Tax=Pyrus ussuriensis x Pyrus communis TaxID=2448454 RepID=A0A5N5GNW4_9ROSA|nr:hypothetical protein D8674_013108 [Pyrus ussuriensis x Pyrus communis]
MADGGARSSKTIDGKGSEKGLRFKFSFCIKFLFSFNIMNIYFVDVRHTYGGSRYRDELIGVVKSDKRDSFCSDVGALVRVECVVDWESWRAIPEELKMHMIDELVPNWDIAKSNPNVMKAINNMVKSRFRE